MARANDPITLQVISRNEGLVGRLLELAASCEREGGVACRVNRRERLEEHVDVFPHLILIDLDSMTDAILEQVTRFRQLGGRSVIVVAYEHPSSERLLKAIRAGASDYLSINPTAEEFVALLGRVSEATERIGARPDGQLISVFSNKGGVGTTTVAINVAAAVAAQVPGEVAVVDLVLRRGDLSAFLDVPTTYTIVNLATELDRTDPSYLRSVLTKHPAGVYVLPAPYDLDEAELVTPVQVNRLLKRLCAAFDAVIIDAGNEVNDASLAALDAADRLLLLTLPSLPAIRNTKRSLQLFERLHYDSSKVVVVVNRHNARARVDRASIEEALGRPIQWSVPNDYLTVVRAMDRGTAVRAIQPRGALAVSFDRLVATHVLPPMNGSPPGRPRTPSHGIRAVRALFGKAAHGTP